MTTNMDLFPHRHTQSQHTLSHARRPQGPQRGGVLCSWGCVNGEFESACCVLLLLNGLLADKLLSHADDLQQGGLDVLIHVALCCTEEMSSIN